MAEGGSDFWRCCGPTPQLRQSHLQLLAQDTGLAPVCPDVWNISKDRDSTVSRVNCISVQSPSQWKLFIDVQREPPVSQFVPTVSAPVSGCKLNYMKFYQNMWKCFLLWGSSTLEKVTWRDCRDSILKMLKTQMDTALCNLLYLTPHKQGSWTRWFQTVFSSLKDSVIFYQLLNNTFTRSFLTIQQIVNSTKPAKRRSENMNAPANQKRMPRENICTSCSYQKWNGYNIFC